MTQKYKVYINNEAKIVTENWSDFCSNYKIIEAAGGLVLNNKNKILMIFRNGKWDLPKGKLNIGEQIEEGAIREVKEECGINELQIEKKLIDTYHTYNLNGLKILKKTFWFLMKTSFKFPLTPQLEEGITKVKWCNEENVSKYLKNSYGNIIDVISSFYN